MCWGRGRVHRLRGSGLIPGSLESSLADLGEISPSSPHQTGRATPLTPTPPASKAQTPPVRPPPFPRTYHAASPPNRGRVSPNCEIRPLDTPAARTATPVSAPRPRRVPNPPAPRPGRTHVAHSPLPSSRPALWRSPHPSTPSARRKVGRRGRGSGAGQREEYIGAEGSIEGRTRNNCVVL